MRLDTANRSFAGLAGASLIAGMVALCGAVGCVLAALVVVRLAEDGVGALASEGAAVWPALAFIVIVGAGAAIGVRSLYRQVRASRALARRVHEMELALPPDLARAAERARLVGRLRLVDCGERFSFAYGALTPRVALSRGLYDSASAEELDAVLAHERYHVRNLDPLKVLLARALPATFFYLPALGHLHTRYVAGRELAADRRALDSCGRRPLAGALYKVLRGPSWPELGGAAAIGGSALLDARLEQLETGAEPPVSGLTPRAVAVSVLGALALTTLFLVSVAGFGGPSAVADLAGGSVTLLDVGGAILCAVPLAVGAWLGYRWLARRTNRPLNGSTVGEPGRDRPPAGRRASQP
ncbi:MAG: M56 family metallopeptidase [Solirubrobacterales bacterium]